MVDTNQDVLQNEAVKKSKDAPKKPAKVKAPVKKEGAPSSAKASAPQGQTFEKIRKFFKGAWAELKKVHWPSRQELINNTIIVLVTVVIVSILIFIVDTGLSKVLEIIIPK